MGERERPLFDLHVRLSKVVNDLDLPVLLGSDEYGCIPFRCVDGSDDFELYEMVDFFAEAFPVSLQDTARCGFLGNSIFL